MSNTQVQVLGMNTRILRTNFFQGNCRPPKNITKSPELILEDWHRKIEEKYDMTVHHGASTKEC